MGLLGTFTTVLYGDIVVSMAPHSFSMGMFSWFPLYWPLQTPLWIHSYSSNGAGGNLAQQQQQHDIIHVTMWCRVHDDQVWYEWSVTVRDPHSGQVVQSTSLHNCAGQSLHVLW